MDRGKGVRLVLGLMTGLWACMTAQANGGTPISDLAVRAKDQKAQLVWTNDPVPASYNVYRGTSSGGPYVHIGSTTSTYSTFLNAGVANGTPYYYVVRGADSIGAELYQSNEASGTPADYSEGNLSNPYRAAGGAADLWGFGLNLDGTRYFAGGLPAPVNASGFDFTAGLGSITVSIAGAGAHKLSLFVDLEIDETTNTYFNETGVSSGAPSAGQSWEIDEPDFVSGNVISHWLANALDDTNPLAGNPNDVSMALGWDFVLGGLDTASVTFLVSTQAPTDGRFFLTQEDGDNRIYFSSVLNVTPGVPEPGTLALIGLGLGPAFASLMRKRRARA